VSVSPDEVAAMIAALERYLRDTAPAGARPPESASPWLRAARLEAVGAARDTGSRWGDGHPWGEAPHKNP